MTKIEQITTKLAKVEQILTALPEARDNDRLLIECFWRWERPNLFNFQSGEAVLRAFVKGELSNPDDITRTRRLVQKRNPALRGTKHKLRAELQSEVTEQINKVLGGDVVAQLDDLLTPASDVPIL